MGQYLYPVDRNKHLEFIHFHRTLLEVYKGITRHEPHPRKITKYEL
jgi:hypothetical protein